MLDNIRRMLVFSFFLFDELKKIRHWGRGKGVTKGKTKFTALALSKGPNLGFFFFFFFVTLMNLSFSLP